MVRSDAGRLGRTRSGGSRQQQTSNAWSGKWNQSAGSAPGTAGHRGGSVRSGLGRSAMGAPSGNAANAAAAAARRKSSMGQWQAQAQKQRDIFSQQALVDAENARARNLMKQFMEDGGFGDEFSGMNSYDFSGGGGGGGAVDHSGAITDAKGFSADATALRGEALAAALAALTSEFDLQEGQYGAEQDTFKGIFDRELANLTQGRGFASDATFDSAADRGILRSGVLKQDLVRADQPFADREATNIAKYNPEEGSLGSEYRRIESALKLLGQQEDAQKKEAEIASEKEQLSADQQLALLISGLGG